jgi:hypothetical protein
MTSGRLAQPATPGAEDGNLVILSSCPQGAPGTKQAAASRRNDKGTGGKVWKPPGGMAFVTAKS